MSKVSDMPIDLIGAGKYFFNKLLDLLNLRVNNA